MFVIVVVERRATDDMKDQDTFQMMEFPEVEDGKVLRGYQMGRPALVRKGGQYRIAYKGTHWENKPCTYTAFLVVKWFIYDQVL